MTFNAGIEAAALNRLPELTGTETDNPTEWRSIAISAVADLFNYAHDVGPERRLVSANAYLEEIENAEYLTRPSSSAPVEQRETVAAWEVIDKGGRNPLIIIKPDQVRLWLRSIADDAGYADRSLSASQVTMDAGSSEETIALGLPQITLMVSNIPNSRVPTDAILSLPGSSRDEVLEEAAKVAECAGCGDPKCSSCYGNQIASAIRALKSGVAK